MIVGQVSASRWLLRRFFGWGSVPRSGRQIWPPRRRYGMAGRISSPSNRMADCPVRGIEERPARALRSSCRCRMRRNEWIAAKCSRQAVRPRLRKSQRDCALLSLFLGHDAPSDQLLKVEGFFSQLSYAVSAMRTIIRLMYCSTISPSPSLTKSMMR